MIKEIDITIDESVIVCNIDFNYFKEDGEVDIQINSISALNSKYEPCKDDIQDMIYGLLTEDEVEDIKYRCQVQYESSAFEYWEQRYEERNSGLTRE